MRIDNFFTSFFNLGVIKWLKTETLMNNGRDRFRTFTNVLGDSLGAGIVHHLSKDELDHMPPNNLKEISADIELDGPLNTSTIDVEKGEVDIDS